MQQSGPQGFNLRHLVREVHDSTDITDHAEMAEAVIARIPTKHRKAALATAMTEYCRWACASFRSAAPVVYPPAPTAGPPSVKSWKRDGIWQRRLHERYATADGVKLLADCTVGDLVFMAEELEKQAARKQAKAAGWRELASWMEAHGFEQVRDVPSGVVDAKLGAAA